MSEIFSNIWFIEFSEEIGEEEFVENNDVNDPLSETPKTEDRSHTSSLQIGKFSCLNFSKTWMAWLTVCFSQEIIRRAVILMIKIRQLQIQNPIKSQIGHQLSWK